jgi:hypothetical protein
MDGGREDKRFEGQHADYERAISAHKKEDIPWRKVASKNTHRRQNYSRERKDLALCVERKFRSMNLAPIMHLLTEMSRLVR